MNKARTRYLTKLYSNLPPKPLTDKELRIKYGSLLRDWTRGFQ